MSTPVRLRQGVIQGAAWDAEGAAHTAALFFTRRGGSFDQLSHLRWLGQLHNLSHSPPLTWSSIRLLYH